MTASADAAPGRGQWGASVAGFVSLLGSSVVSAAGFVVIASHRWTSFDAGVGLFIILFAQWQSLGLTIAKNGIEQVVFAMVSADEKLYLDPGRYVRRRVLPLAALFSLAVVAVFSPLAAAVACLSIAMDSYSVMVIADLNARREYRAGALANLFNYPLFFLALYAANRWGRASVTVTLLLFLLSSLVRFLWCRSKRVALPGMAEMSCQADLQMGAQQALNYLLFRGDQIVLALAGLQAQVQQHLDAYIFLAKFPELAAGVLGVAGTVLFPKAYLKYPFQLGALRDRLRLLLAGVGLTGSLLLALVVYLSFWKGAPIAPFLALPFLVHALCILVVNNITYSTLRQGYLERLLGNLLLSLGAGLVLLCWLGFDFSLAGLSWLVPVQLLCFVAAGLLLPWGRSRELYG